jgi:hypothetical protein
MNPYHESLISYYESTANSKKSKRIVSFEELKALILDDSFLAVNTSKLREILSSKGLESYQNAKKNLLPAVTVSGTFNPAQRNHETLIQHSGLIQVDFDKLSETGIIETLEKLKKDHHCFACFCSPSEKGVKGFFRCRAVENDTEHKKIFSALDEYLFKRYEMRNDPSVKDVSRLCILCHDPNFYHNPDAIVFDDSQYEVKQPIKRKSEPQPITIPAPRNDAEKYALEVLQTACKNIETAIDGERHITRRNNARTLGGYVSQNQLDSDFFLNALLQSALRNTDSPSNAEKTIRGAFEHGKTSPIAVKPIEQEDLSGIQESVNRMRHKQKSEPQSIQSIQPIRPENEDDEQEKIPDLLEFPRGIFPLEIESYLEKVTASLNLNYSSGASCFLASLSFACGSYYQARLTKTWKGKPCLWVGLVGDSGIGKSPLLSLTGFGFMKRWEKDQETKFKSYIHAYKEQNEDTLTPCPRCLGTGEFPSRKDHGSGLEKCLPVSKNGCGGHGYIKASDFDKVFNFAKDYIENADYLEKMEAIRKEVKGIRIVTTPTGSFEMTGDEKPIPQKPYRPRFGTDNATMEAIIQKHSKHPIGFGYFADELRVFILGLDAFSRVKGLAQVLMTSLKTSLDPVTTDRIDKNDEEDSRTIRIPHVPLCGGLQFHFLDGLLKDTEKQEEGFIARFLFCLIEERVAFLGSEDSENFTDKLTRNEELKLENILTRFLNDRLPYYPTPENSFNPPKPEPIVFDLELDAKPLVHAFNDHLTRKKMEAEKSIGLAYPKLKGEMAGIAVLLHRLWIAENFLDERTAPKIQKETIQKAIEVTRYFERNLEVCYSRVFQSEENKKKQKVFDAIKALGGRAKHEQIKDKLRRAFGGKRALGKYIETMVQKNELIETHEGKEKFLYRP